MNKGWASYMDNSNGSRELFLFTKHNAKSKGPHLNMIQRTLKNWPGKNSKAFFLTEIKVQSFEKIKLLRCLTSPEARSEERRVGKEC